MNYFNGNSVFGKVPPLLKFKVRKYLPVRSREAVIAIMPGLPECSLLVNLVKPARIAISSKI